MAAEIVGLDTIAELSVALAGFSALLAMFRGGPIERWHPRARMGFWLVIAYSLGALFFSLLPSLFVSLGATSWRGPMALLATYFLLTTAISIRENIRLVSAGFPMPSKIVWVVGFLATAATVVWLLYAVGGGMEEPTGDAYLVGVLLAFFLACICFLTVLQLREPAP